MTRDIHDYGRRLSRALKILRDDPGLSESNRKAILEFAHYCQAEGLQAPTIVRKAAKALARDFGEATYRPCIRADITRGINPP